MIFGNPVGSSLAGERFIDLGKLLNRRSVSFVSELLNRWSAG